MNGHRSLVAWQRCHALARAVYEATARFPASERYELTSQLRRAAASASANIAEGRGRFGPGELSHGLSIAMGSLAEVDALLQLAADVGYLDPAAHNALQQLRDQAGAALFGLHRRLRAPR